VLHSNDRRYGISVLLSPGLVDSCFTRKHEVCWNIVVYPLAECDSTLGVNPKIVVRIFPSRLSRFKDMDRQPTIPPFRQPITHFLDELQGPSSKICQGIPGTAYEYGAVSIPTSPNEVTTELVGNLRKLHGQTLALRQSQFAEVLNHPWSGELDVMDVAVFSSGEPLFRLLLR